MYGCESAGETAKPCKAKVQGDRKALQGEGAGRSQSPARRRCRATAKPCKAKVQGDRRKCIARPQSPAKKGLSVFLSKHKHRNRMTHKPSGFIYLFILLKIAIQINYLVILATSAAKSSTFFSMPSPRSKRTHSTTLIEPPSFLASAST